MPNILPPQGQHRQSEKKIKIRLWSFFHELCSLVDFQIIIMKLEMEEEPCFFPGFMTSGCLNLVWISQ